VHDYDYLMTIKRKCARLPPIEDAIGHLDGDTGTY
jgi:hypothetical protein